MAPAKAADGIAILAERVEFISSGQTPVLMPMSVKCSSIGRRFIEIHVTCRVSGCDVEWPAVIGRRASVDGAVGHAGTDTGMNGFVAACIGGLLLRETAADQCLSGDFLGNCVR